MAPDEEIRVGTFIERLFSRLILPQWGRAGNRAIGSRSVVTVASTTACSSSYHAFPRRLTPLIPRPASRVALSGQRIGPAVSAGRAALRTDRRQG